VSAKCQTNFGASVVESVSPNLRDAYSQSYKRRHFNKIFQTMALHAWGDNSVAGKDKTHVVSRFHVGKFKRPMRAGASGGFNCQFDAILAADSF
jgi:hypothetical protein